MMSRIPQCGAMRRRQRLILLGVACLAIRAIIPVGYMPGNLLAGEFMVLCPTGLPAGIAQSIHQDHGNHGKNVLDADQSCPIGSALQPAWLPAAEAVLQFAAHASDSPEIDNYDQITVTNVLRYHSRAPPHI